MILVLIIISAVCITEKSFVNLVKSGSGKAYHHAKENMDIQREIHAERKEERGESARSRSCGALI